MKAQGDGARAAFAMRSADLAGELSPGGVRAAFVYTWQAAGAKEVREEVVRLFAPGEERYALRVRHEDGSGSTFVAGVSDSLHEMRHALRRRLEAVRAISACTVLAYATEETPRNPHQKEATT